MEVHKYSFEKKLFLLSVIVSCFHCTIGNAIEVDTSGAYPRNPYVSEDVWDQVSPYFLPEDHPIRPILDQIFSYYRVTLSIKSMKKAGFIHPKPRKWTHLIVTKHPDLPGYIFKLHLDAQRHYKKKPEYIHWIKRIQGAHAIDKKIQKYHWEHLFKVPEKWIYPLPEEPSPPKEFIRKNFILVEEDMDIFDDKENYGKWRSDWITADKLDSIYIILEELGLHDCAKPDNIPFSKDGRISFIDTETTQEWPVLYKKLTHYLSPPMRSYWKHLTR